jgi:hypothetical protein
MAQEDLPMQYEQPSTRELLQTDEARETIKMLRQKGLPPGWHPLRFYECQCRHDRDAVVLCERTMDDGDHGTMYVVWWVNMTSGGCCHGHYTDDEFEAVAMYNSRRRALA